MESKKLIDELIFVPIEINENTLTQRKDDPSQDEIAAMCERIQSGWTGTDEMNHRGINITDDHSYKLPSVRTDTEGAPLNSDMKPQ